MKAPEPIRLSSFIPVPNPSRGPVQFRWDVAGGYDTGNLKIYDVAGHRIRTIGLGPSGAGVTTYLWDGADSRGRPLANGVYIVRISLTDSSGKSIKATTKVALLR